MSVTHEVQALSKLLWRYGYVDCPESCDIESGSIEDCACSKNMEKIKGKSTVDILDESEILDSLQFFDAEGHLVDSFYDEDGVAYTTLPNYSEEETTKMYEQILNLFANPGHIGSMFQATSTNDITFWVLHPSIDRLWHWKRFTEEDLVEDSTFDESWDPFHTCYGHNPDNLQPFTNLFGESTDTFYSNIELYKLVHPKSQALPYMYDSFEWPHCELVGDSMKP